MKSEGSRKLKIRGGQNKLYWLIKREYRHLVAFALRQDLRA